MTAHASKPTITPERLAWFARYHHRHAEWGVFHVALSDGNWTMTAQDDGRDEWPVDVREHAEWFDKLTQSQRRRLGKKAEQLARTPWHLLDDATCRLMGIRFHGDPGTPTAHLGPNPSIATPPTDTVKR